MEGGDVINFLKLIEIEIHSYCNRKCDWCPNKIIDRNRKIEMEESVYKKIIKELRSERYQDRISYSRYNEPMSDIGLLKQRVAYAKSMLPEAILVTNTNGDFLNNYSIDGLLIDELSIMDYDNKGMAHAIKKLSDLNVDIHKVSGNKVYGSRWNMEIMYFVDWPKNSLIGDRGGILKSYSKTERQNTCKEPLYFAGIDYNGNVMPCCNMRSDNPNHSKYILGNIKTERLKDIYEKDKVKGIRKKASSLSPCRYCIKEPGRYTREEPGIEYK